MRRPLDADRVFPAIAFPTIFAMAVQVGVQPDTWWLLRTGQEIVRTHRPVTTELWSSTVRGDHWPNHETLTEVGFYLVHRIGGMPLLAVLLGTLLTATWYLLYRTLDAPPRFRAIAVLVGAYVQASNYGLRPFLLTMVFFTLCLVLLPRPRWHPAIPLLFLVWASSHGGVSYGGLLLVVATAAAWFTDRPRFWHWVRVSAASAVATLLNPLGIGLWRLVLHTFDNRFLRETTEWQSLRLDDTHGFRIAGLLLAAAVALVVSRRRRWDHERVVVVALAVLLGVLSVRAYRHSAIFAPVAAVVLATALHDRRPAAPPDRGMQRIYGVVVVATWALLAAISVPWVLDDPATEPVSDEIAAGLRACDGPLYTTFNNGAFLLWWVRDRPVFVDNRQDPYPQDLLFASQRAASGDYEQLFAEYGIRCAFTSAEDQLTLDLRDAGWTQLVSDSSFAVFAAPP